MSNEKAIKDLKEMFFRQLDNIYSACETTAKEYHSKSIPLHLLKLAIDASKKGFDKGLKEQMK